MSSTSSARFALAGVLPALFLLGGCATLGASSSGPTPLGAPSDDARDEADLSGNEKRAFEDAVATWQEQQKAGIQDFEALEERWQRAVKRAPGVGEAWYNLGVVLERRGKLEEAEKAYRTALKKKPTLKEAAENLAVIHQNRGRAREALKIYHQILRLYPDDANARVRLADQAQGWVEATYVTEEKPAKATVPLSADDETRIFLLRR